MESTIRFSDPRTLLTGDNALKTVALATSPAVLAAATTARFVPLALITAFIGLALVSIRKSAAEGNKSTTENVVIGSILIGAAIVWGYFIAGALFLQVPVLALVLTRNAGKNVAQAPSPVERTLVHH